MKNFKKCISMLLVICILVLSINIVSFANPSDSVPVKVDEDYTTIELAAIDRERLEMHNNIMEQLIAQNATDQYAYFEALCDSQFNNLYFPISSKAVKYYAPNGGWVRAYNNTVAATNEYMTAPNAKKFREAMKNDTPETALGAMAVAGFGAAWTGFGVVIGFTPVYHYLMGNLSWNSLCDGSNPIFVASTYDKLDLNTTTVITKWTNYPYMSNNLDSVGNVTYHTY